MSIGRRRYEIVQALGSGAFGTVYKALLTTDRGFVKEVALKIMRDDIDSDLVEEMARRQRDEARLLGLVRHRAILHVDGLVRLNNNWAVVMEFVDGANLHNVLRASRVPPAVAAEIIAEVAGGLRAAYEARSPDGSALQLIHRDVKPSNIALTENGGVKLLDFGVARGQFEHREAETTGVLLGTLAYMAPERFDGIDSPAGDVYALGVVMAELLTRKRMSKASGNQERHANIVRTTIHRVRGVCPEAEYNPLIRLLVRMLAYNIEDRPTARECERLLREIVRGLPHADLPSWAEVVVSKVKAQTPETSDDLVGETLVERSETAIAGASTGAASSSPWRWVAVVLALAGLSVGMMAAGGLTFLLVDMFGPEAPGPEVEVRALETSPEPATDPPEEPIPEAPPEEPPAEVLPSVAPEPERSVVAPSPALAEPLEPVAASAGRRVGWVDVEGEGVDIRLVGESGSQGPGDVPVGTYLVMARFGGGDEMEVGQIQVIENGAVAIVCDKTFQNCRIQ